MPQQAQSGAGVASTWYRPRRCRGWSRIITLTEIGRHFSSSLFPEQNRRHSKTEV